MKKYFLVVLFLVGFLFMPFTAKAEMLIGWWADINHRSLFSTWASFGVNFVHCNWCYAGYYRKGYSAAEVKAFLDAAQANGMKVSMTANNDANVYSYASAWPATAAEFISWINLSKSHPALWGWYLSDEPEITKDVAGAHTKLGVDPGYYKLAKTTDPNHDAWLVNCCPLNTDWDDVRDIYALDFYVKNNSSTEWQSSSVRSSYDKWKSAYDLAKSRNKLPFLMVPQGMGLGYQSYGDLTPDELRYHVYTGLVLGIDKVLFWTYGETNSNVAGMVNKLISQITSIKKELENGTTNSGITVSQPSSSLPYRYGASGNSHAILAVNIANRGSTSGQTLSNVQFTLPSGVRPSKVTVVGETRTIPVNSSGVFTDTFNKFAVHIYQFTTSGSTPTPTPTASPTPTPTATPSFSPSPSPSPSSGPGGSGPSACDLNKDSQTNVLDYQSLVNVILGVTSNPGGYDINKDGAVNVLDAQALVNVILGKSGCPQ